MAETRHTASCIYCGNPHSVIVVVKQTKYSRSIKIKRCEDCGKQQGIKQTMDTYKLS